MRNVHYFSKKIISKYDPNGVCELRPMFVLLKKYIPHDNCIYRYHENISLLNWYLTTVIQDFRTNFHDFINTVVCDKDNEIFV